jgi:hypothetical protein
LSDTTDNRGERARSLRDAIRQVRTAETERADVVVELRDAERARLEMLADELRSVFNEVPANDEQFIFTVAPGTPPRLWIDMTSFVVMGRDRRVYRFLKDSRLGRTVILETPKIEDVADTVTHYVAERIIERERAMEGDWLIKRVQRDDASRLAEESRRDDLRRVEAREAMMAAAAMRDSRRRPDPRYLGWAVAAFLAGLLVGILALFAYAWIAVG